MTRHTAHRALCLIAAASLIPALVVIRAHFSHVALMVTDGCGQVLVPRSVTALGILASGGAVIALITMLAVWWANRPKVAALTVGLTAAQIALTLFWVTHIARHFDRLFACEVSFPGYTSLMRVEIAFLIALVLMGALALRLARRDDQTATSPSPT